MYESELLHLGVCDLPGEFLVQFGDDIYLCEARPITFKASDRSPDFCIFYQKRQIGALWQRTSATTGRPFYSGRLLGLAVLCFDRGGDWRINGPADVWETHDRQLWDTYDFWKTERQVRDQTTSTRSRWSTENHAAPPPPPPPRPKPSNEPEWAQVLGISARDGVTAVKVAWRKAALTTHPDRGGSTDAFIKAREAYELGMAYYGIHV